MSLPGNHTLTTIDLTAYTPSCGASPASAYIRAPFRGTVKKFTGTLGGSITTTDGTMTVTNLTQGTVVGTFAFPQLASAAGSFFYGMPASSTLGAVNEDDILQFTPSGAAGASVPMYISAVIRAS